MLTLQMVRDHLRIDDGDYDPALPIYVAAAVEAAEQYSGVTLRAGEACEDFQNPVGHIFRLTGRPSGPVTARVHIAGRVMTYPATVSGRNAVLPVSLDCGVTLLQLCFRVGPANVCGDAVADASPMIELGILKFISHAWTHRGDAPEDWAKDSGAASMWRSMRNPMFGGGARR